MTLRGRGCGNRVISVVARASSALGGEIPALQSLDERRALVVVPIACAFLELERRVAGTQAVNQSINSLA